MVDVRNGGLLSFRSNVTYGFAINDSEISVIGLNQKGRRRTFVLLPDVIGLRNTLRKNDFSEYKVLKL